MAASQSPDDHILSKAVTFPKINAVKNGITCYFMHKSRAGICWHVLLDSAANTRLVPLHSTSLTESLFLSGLHVPYLVLSQIEREAAGVCRLKLGDFGLAMVVTEPVFTICGTPTYVAPEILCETGR